MSEERRRLADWEIGVPLLHIEPRVRAGDPAQISATVSDYFGGRWTVRLRITRGTTRLRVHLMLGEQPVVVGFASTLSEALEIGRNHANQFAEGRIRSEWAPNLAGPTTTPT